MEHPCAWMHLSCFVDFMKSHVTEIEPSIKIKAICMICEVDVRADELIPLYGQGGNQRKRPAAWVHLECIGDY